MPHWSIPTQIENVNEGGTYYTTACGTYSMSRRESIKDVTCKACKKQYFLPTESGTAAAKLLHDVMRIVESDDVFARVTCNACDLELDVTGFEYDMATETIKRILTFMGHVAFEHVGGAEINLARVETAFYSYGLNLAVGKPAMTEMEERWRCHVREEGLVNG